MVKVSKASFFATVGQLDVHPSIVGVFDHAKGDYRSDWEMRWSRHLVGRSFAGEYFVTHEFLAANKATLSTEA